MSSLVLTETTGRTIREADVGGEITRRSRRGQRKDREKIKKKEKKKEEDVGDDIMTVSFCC